MLGKGITLSGSVTGTIGHIRNVRIGDTRVDDLDNTDADTSGYHRSFEPGLIDSGNFTCDVLYDATYAAAILAAYKNRITEVWTVTFADTNRRIFPGYPNACGLEAPYDNLVTFNFGIKISGRIQTSSSSSSSSSSSISSSSSSA